MIHENILKTIGNTPVVHLKRLFPGPQKVFMKLERNNPGGSIKDRIALAMVEDAERKGIIGEGSTIIEPTSGNTGIGLGLVAAVKGYRLILTMPESMSVERRKILSAYGAELVLTPRELGMKGAIAKARELAAEIPGAWIPMQFENRANVQTHIENTAREVVTDFPGGLDYLITGVGTGGHISGVSEVIKPLWPDLKVFAVEPAASPVISGGQPGPHPIQGIGAGFIPANLNTSLLDGTVRVEKEAAYLWAGKAAREEGILVGISTGASLAAIASLMAEMPEGANILTFNYDTGERYLSIEGLF